MSSIIKKMLSIALCLCIIFSAASVLQYDYAYAASAASVTFTEVSEYVAATTSVNIRKGPGTEHARVGTISKNSQVLRIGVGDNGWSKVIYKGSIAYMNSKYIRSTEHNPSKDVSGTKINGVHFDLVNEEVKTTTSVNIRKGPGTSYSRITTLKSDTTLIRIGVGENGWSRVLYKNNVVYISSKYIKAVKTSENKEPAQDVKTETVYATGNVNIRSGPSTQYKSLGVLKKYDSIERLGVESNGWNKVLYKGQVAYISGKYLTTEKPSNGSSTQYPIKYEDDTCKITIYREWFENAWVYAAHIEFTDYERLSTECANGRYNNGYETTSHAANRLNALLAINGCYSAPKLNYTVVRNGKIWNGSDRNMYIPAVYSSHNGLLQSAWESGGTKGIVGVNVQKLVDNGLVTDTFCFGPPGMTNGVITDTNTNGSRAQRTFIGTNGKAGDIWLCVADGRYNDGVSAGLTGNQCMRYLESKGCTFGVNLDGGGSSTFVWKGKVLNAAQGNERAIVDFVYFK
jgi:uncharacterized protein YgiM (DUF1202 family)